MVDLVFKKILNKELKEQGMTYYQLAKITGLSSRAISYYANGERVPSIHYADIILRALRVEMILGEKDQL